MFGIVKQLKRIADALETQSTQQTQILALWRDNLEISYNHLSMEKIRHLVWLRESERRAKIEQERESKRKPPSVE